MKNTEINPQTLPSDLEQLIGRAFEDYGKKKQFSELEHFLGLLTELGYRFNIIRELKQVKVIPFKKFICMMDEKPRNNAKAKSIDIELEEIRKQKVQAVNENNYELASVFRDMEKELLEWSNEKKGDDTIRPQRDIQHFFGPKILKTHVIIEKSMIHIYLITRQDWFADKVHELTINKPKGRFAWFKALVGKI